MKRKTEALTTETYDVIETVENCDSYVDFVPHSWLVPLKKSDKIKVKDNVKFYYPRRLANQTKDKYIKFTKQAKFTCSPPENNEKWELRNCRVLKMDLASIEEAIQGQKLYSDYFSTTEAEAEPAVKVQRTVKSKTTKKTKTRAPAKTVESSSDSDGETSALKQVSDFNTCFENGPQNVFKLGADTNDFSSFNTFTLNDMQPFDETGLYDNVENIQNNDCNASNVMMLDLDDLNNYTLPNNDLMTIQLSNPTQTVNDFQAVPFENQNQETGSASGSVCCVHSNCKCYQKLLNKMDYLQKKLLNEVSSIRNDIKSNQEFLMKLFESKQNQGEDSAEIVHREESLEQELSDDEINEFTRMYKNFPISAGDELIEMNDTIANDGKLRKFLFYKFEKLQIKDADAFKMVRKILKLMCGVYCISEFTWLGTNKGKKKKNFSILKSIVDLIVDVTEKRFSSCDGNAVLKAVFQQRAKSASEAADKLKQLDLIPSGTSQDAAKTSQDAAKVSQDAAKVSQDAVKTSQDAAEPSITEAELARMSVSNN